MNCKVCNKKLITISKDIFACIDYSDEEIETNDHNHSLSFFNSRLIGQELIVYNRSENTGYLVDVDYDCKNTLFATIKDNKYHQKIKKNMIFSFDNFDRNTFIERFEKLMVLF